MVGNEEERIAAASLIPIVKRHHQLLVTLLLFNSLANESLPIILRDLVPSWLAILLSVFLVLIFGEV
jgi:metal transporter CNNM